MNIIELQDIIQNIPGILQYFVPGYIFMLIFKFFYNKNIEKYIVLILSCALSYVFLSLSALFYKGNDIWVVSILTIFIAIICSILFSFFYANKAFAWILVHTFHKTVNDDIWHDVLDFENGSNLKVYFKDKDYYVIGSYHTSEDHGNDSWFAISGYGKFDKKTNEQIGNSFIDRHDIIMTFRLSDVEHIEIF